MKAIGGLGVHLDIVNILTMFTFCLSQCHLQESQHLTVNNGRWLPDVFTIVVKFNRPVRVYTFLLDDVIKQLIHWHCLPSLQPSVELMNSYLLLLWKWWTIERFRRPSAVSELTDFVHHLQLLSYIYTSFLYIYCIYMYELNCELWTIDSAVFLNKHSLGEGCVRTALFVTYLFYFMWLSDDK